MLETSVRQHNMQIGLYDYFSVLFLLGLCVMFHIEMMLFMTHSKAFIDQACLVKMDKNTNKNQLRTLANFIKLYTFELCYFKLRKEKKNSLK